MYNTCIAITSIAARHVSKEKNGPESFRKSRRYVSHVNTPTEMFTKTRQSEYFSKKYLGGPRIGGRSLKGREEDRIR